MIAQATKYKPGVFPHECACCGARHTEDVWRVLSFVGIYDHKRDGMPGFTQVDLEYRNCSCGSTMAVQIEEV